VSASNMAMDDLMTLDQPSPSQQQINLPEIISAQQLLESNICEPPELVEGLFRKEEKVLIGGRSKAMKSWAAIDLAISVSEGIPFWNLKTEKGKVLIINLELMEGTLKRRLKIISEARGLKKIPNVFTLNLRGYPTNAAKLLEYLSKQMKPEYDLIIIDPLYKLTAGKEENAAGEMAVVMNTIEEIIKITRAAVVIPAHFAKGDSSKKDSIDRISGSGVFARDPDSIITITGLEEDKTFIIEANLRSLPPINPFTLRWNFPVFQVDPSIDKTKIKPAKSGRPPKYTVEQIVEVLGNKKKKSAEWQAECNVKTGIAASSFHSLKNIAKAKNLVTLIGGYFQKSTSNNSDNPELDIRTSPGSGNSDNPITL
jgi:hypothetical protein